MIQSTLQCIGTMIPLNKICKGTVLSYERLLMTTAEHAAYLERLLTQKGEHVEYLERLLVEKDTHAHYFQRTLISVSLIAAVVIVLFAVLTSYLMRTRDEQRRRLENLFEGIIQEKNKRIEELEKPAEKPAGNGSGHQQPHFVYAMPNLPPALTNTS